MAMSGAAATEIFHHTHPDNPDRHGKAVRDLFDQHASVTQDGARYLTPDDFSRALQSYAPATVRQQPGGMPSADDYRLLFRIADTEKRGLVSLANFLMFQSVLTRPYAEFELAFRYFDTQGRGTITTEDFQALARASNQEADPAFQLNPDWLRLYTADDQVDYKVFAQMIHELQLQRLQHAFRTHDPQGTGVIPTEAFQSIVAGFAHDRVSRLVIEHIPALGHLGRTKPHRLSYPVLLAFYQLVQRTDYLEGILIQAAESHPEGLVTRDSFLRTAAQISRAAPLTPLETDLLFHLVEVEALSNSVPVDDMAVANTHRVFHLADFRRLLDPAWQHTAPLRPVDQATATDTVAGDAVKALVSPSSSPGLMRWVIGAAAQAYTFGLGAVAGAVGATVVYPIDLVKTRMQNQRSAVVGEVLYRNSLDCFRKVIRNEGLMGLYRGLAPQLVGVAPEKAIKLTMNDLVRTYTTDPKTGAIPFWAEIMAGCVAGGSQVVFTNPLEIVKIRLQVQGEMLKTVDAVPRQSAVSIVRQLGLVGLYRGAGACLLRDIPFSAIYFPVYAHLKKDVFLETPGVKLGIWQLLVAGAVAGMPAAYLTTPADVIKTRLQVEARKGQTVYTGIMDATRKIYAEEGFRAFFKGGLARVFRSSPQFGTTLMVYELLQRNLPFPGGVNPVPAAELPAGALGKKTSSSPGIGEALIKRPLAKVGILSPTYRRELHQQAPLAFIRARNAVRLLQDVQYGFGTLPASTLPSKASK
ncbi:mitochondrial aspartate-glutamate transporter agc1 [Tieghemiomyces parasiticus]|uniref:Mitochondrial aspartate-glutamate transporter AGC1 n=1 Tax=Tieghemiomyces parasiticus TaxID=78921 RepID=A0A9W8A9U2_9FUNG|nr:mitochondrial aspartate-glutamate transporter agc1 [Tieghemiomyces parasiticus]